jgi:hypothetical protein
LGERLGTKPDFFLLSDSRIEQWEIPLSLSPSLSLPLPFQPHTPTDPEGRREKAEEQGKSNGVWGCSRDARWRNSKH